MNEDMVKIEMPTTLDIQTHNVSMAQLNFISIVHLFCSNKDTRWVSHVFRRNKWKDGSRLFDLEKDNDFRLLVPQRDFEPGTQTGNRVAEGIQQSRKVIVIVSRSVTELGINKELGSFEFMLPSVRPMDQLL